MATSEERELADEFVEDGAEPFPGPGLGLADVGRRTGRLEDDVDRAVLEMEARAVRRPREDRTAQRRSAGQGLSGRLRRCFASERAATVSSGTIDPTWPPIAS